MGKRRTPAREARCSIRAWARQAGIAPSTALKAARDGRVVVGRDGRVLPSVASRQFVERTRPRPDSPRTNQRSAARDLFLRARLLRERVRMREARRRWRELDARLVAVAPLRRTMKGLAAAIRSELMAAPARIAPTLAGVTDPGEAVRLLDSYMHDLCVHIAGLTTRDAMRERGAEAKAAETD